MAKKKTTQIVQVYQSLKQNVWKEKKTLFNHTEKDTNSTEWEKPHKKVKWVWV